MAEPSNQSAINLFRILIMVSPVVMGAIVYYVLTEFMGIDTMIAAGIAFGVACAEWLVFKTLIKKLENR